MGCTCIPSLDAQGSHKGKHVLAKCKILSFDFGINPVAELPETTLGERLKKLRLQKGLHIKALAALCCVSEVTIGYIERGLKEPNISTLSKLSSALGTDNRYLLGANDWPEDTPGQIIKKYRMINGWTQRQLAARSGVDPSTILSYENNRHKRITKKKLQAIYQALGYHLG